MTDRLASSNSPMNCVRPPVGQMFFEGARRIKASRASLQPVRVLDDCDRVIVEAYPRLVANHFIGRENYKEADSTEPQRQAILNGVRSPESNGPMAQGYGFIVQIDEEHVKKAVKDRNGDLLDSILRCPGGMGLSLEGQELRHPSVSPSSPKRSAGPRRVDRRSLYAASGAEG